MSRFTQHAGGGLWYQTKEDKRREYLFNYAAAIGIGLALGLTAFFALSR